ncbi:MAG: DUF3122 domain-containing protein [Cyanobacteria bacterium P01_G01_bin.39]
MFDKSIKTISCNHQIVGGLLRLFNLALAVALGLLTICSPAYALLRQHHETPNVLRYHAQDSLKDRDGNTWQVLLFPDNRFNSSTTYYLRLVGFPGVNSFIHPQSLEILTNQGKILTAADAYAESAPAPNVGQYNLTPIVAQLTSAKSLKLSLPLNNQRQLALKIVPEVLAEWRLLTQELEP